MSVNEVPFVVAQIQVAAVAPLPPVAFKAYAVFWVRVGAVLFVDRKITVFLVEPPETPCAQTRLMLTFVELAAVAVCPEGETSAVTVRV